MLTDIASPVEKLDNVPESKITTREPLEEVVQRVVNEIAADAREAARQYLDEVVTPHGGE